MTIKENIVFIIPTFKRGGVERVTLNVLNSLDTSRFVGHLLICSSTNNHLKKFLKKEIVCVELDKKNVRSALSSIFKYINEVKPSIVFSSFGHISLPLLIYKSVFKASYKVIVRFNSLPSNKLGSTIRSKLYGVLLKKFINNAEFVVSQTDQMREEIINKYKLDNRKVLTINNPVDIKSILDLSMDVKEEVPFDSNTFNFVAVGSLDEVKGFDLLIESAYLLKEQGVSGFKIYIIGDNRDPNRNYGAELKEMITTLGLDNIVFLLGFKSNPFPYIKKANSFILSSRKEGFPNVVLEALVLKTKCVVTNCVDFTGIIEEGVNGYVVDKNNAESLSVGIKTIMNSELLMSDFALKQFDFNKWFKGIINK